jgi:hypothetical protein
MILLDLVSQDLTAQKSIQSMVYKETIRLHPASASHTSTPEGDKLNEKDSGTTTTTTTTAAAALATYSDCIDGSFDGVSTRP